jgi:hypothetical protein
MIATAAASAEAAIGGKNCFSIEILPSALSPVLTDYS